MATQTTRSRTRQISSSQQLEDAAITQNPRLVLKGASIATNIDHLPDSLSPRHVNLDQEDFELLLLKQTKLYDPNGQVSTFLQSLRSGSDVLGEAVTAATLVFAQHEAGTAVCISPHGLMLTCSHCVGESSNALPPEEEKWLLFASGRVVRAKCVAWDEHRDLALLQITAAQQSPNNASTRFTFPSAIIGTSQGSQLLCIGHPGSEDLEASTSGIETNYDVLHISIGRFRGLAAGQDPQDNSEIGALMHDCWTYWGHSGAPLLSMKDGKLVGLHSSWDDSTGMRRGVALVAIRAFLDEHTAVVVDG